MSLAPHGRALVRSPTEGPATGLSTEVGKTFEETKQALAGEGVPQFGCRACVTALPENDGYCPYCGEQAVLTVE